ncbi:hypothetical protein CEXT_538261 [Caerostris extrusa]|uniref:Uncharacterized protein n=1 Tax=Caerostris extrusa TaxID=172846 RepID=A0AAV4XDQ3_CAEEX|nr:hypothetical protein CEXT_538261 [Caerostris extrusa]
MAQYPQSVTANVSCYQAPQNRHKPTPISAEDRHAKQGRGGTVTSLSGPGHTLTSLGRNWRRGPPSDCRKNPGNLISEVGVNRLRIFFLWK